MADNIITIQPTNSKCSVRGSSPAINYDMTEEYARVATLKQGVPGSATRPAYDGDIAADTNKIIRLVTKTIDDEYAEHKAQVAALLGIYQQQQTLELSTRAEQTRDRLIAALPYPGNVSTIKIDMTPQTAAVSRYRGGVRGSIDGAGVSDGYVNDTFIAYQLFLENYEQRLALSTETALKLLGRQSKGGGRHSLLKFKYQWNKPRMYRTQAPRWYSSKYDRYPFGDRGEPGCCMCFNGRCFTPDERVHLSTRDCCFFACIPYGGSGWCDCENIVPLEKITPYKLVLTVQITLKPISVASLSLNPDDLDKVSLYSVTSLPQYNALFPVAGLLPARNI